ncbi:MAG: hypothetical protein WB543_09800 [Candidatus Acidiferrum sp.]
MPLSHNPLPANRQADSHPSGTGTLVLVFRIVRWSAYAFALILLILLLHKTPPPPVAITPEAAASAEQKVQKVQQSASQGQPATLRMNETELNSYLASHLTLSGSMAMAAPPNAAPSSAPDGTSSADQPSAYDVAQMRSNVKDVKVQLIDDHVRAYVVFNLHGKDMTLQLEGKLRADEGFLQFVPLSGQIGALPIPQATLEAAMRKMMDSPENREKLKLPSDLSDLRIENGEVVAQYQ